MFNFMYSKETIMMFRFFFAKNIIHDVWHLINKKIFTSNAKRLDGSSNCVDGSADAAAAPVIDVLSKMARCGNLAACRLRLEQFFV
jgi:hypothetical protein